ncbi:type I restriction-modification system subunit M [Fructilactobacillus ixorae]|uniref:site-specific DNA-methyltransferase (adenine-specific) n=1 Tax=Fructilactobacillus ixorae TaxID=1750535 RepID=A0ABY5C2U9_9LACO|nr:type I restriction-modification system subunit M [Fructilactobacillus ixorae]USS93109.1 type I restriction-modification system subunit M [Fructilactobacillus ixorae]
MVLDAKTEALVWRTLNQTRGKMEPLEYKNYVFGIMFYQYLSKQAQAWLQAHAPATSLKAIWQAQPAQITAKMQSQLGYVIQPGDLFSDWQAAIEAGQFKLEMMQTALTRFQQRIAPVANAALSGIFADLDLTATRLGNTAKARTATITDMIKLMSEIELDDDSDVLGDLYEYLMGMFATHAATKTGEFYTPQPVSEIMAQIVTAGHEEATNYRLYDPTMGSGSLLLTTAKHLQHAKQPGTIQYYGQELLTTTYNLARMNLMMHQVDYRDFHLRNADTLTRSGTLETEGTVNESLKFDAVMANPPYSLRWDNQNRENEPQFEMGIAPKSKADYAFLLHGLYHLKQTGRMAIVLPHGVLFCGGAEGRIRKQLLEHHQISAVIGLPEKIFTNTEIATVILVLEKQRERDDVLFIDASHDGVKIKKQHQLRQRDVTQIVKTYLDRTDVDKYAHVASLNEIRANHYKLNINRYVDAVETAVPVNVAKVATEMQELHQREKRLIRELNGMLNNLSGSTAEKQNELRLIKKVLR